MRTFLHTGNMCRSDSCVTSRFQLPLLRIRQMLGSFCRFVPLRYELLLRCSFRLMLWWMRCPPRNSYFEKQLLRSLASFLWTTVLHVGIQANLANLSFLKARCYFGSGRCTAGAGGRWCLRFEPMAAHVHQGSSHQDPQTAVSSAKDSCTECASTFTPMCSFHCMCTYFHIYISISTGPLQRECWLSVRIDCTAPTFALKLQVEVKVNDSEGMWN